MQLKDLLPRVAAAKNQLNAIELAMLREADRHQVGDAVGAANTAGWWASATRSTKPGAHRAVALAERLDDDEHAPTRTAMECGQVSVEQAQVILRAVEQLPTDLVEPALRRDVEEHLVGHATVHGPVELRLLGRRALDVLAPEAAENADRRALEAEERAAASIATFTMRPDGAGSMRGRLKIPILQGEIFAKHLHALAAPKHRAATTEPLAPRVARPLRMGTAFLEYLETRAASGMPKAGGVPATVVVTMTLESLLGGGQLGGGQIGGGQIALLDTGCEALQVTGQIPLVVRRRSIASTAINIYARRSLTGWSRGIRPDLFRAEASRTR